MTSSARNTFFCVDNHFSIIIWCDCCNRTSIGYRGSMCFETFRVTDLTPQPLWDSALSHIINIGKYFRDRILSESDTDI